MRTNRSRFPSIATLILATVTLVGCAGVEVEVDRPAGELVDAPAKLAGAETYGWSGFPYVTEGDFDDAGELTDAVMTGVDSRLEAMGLRRIDTRKPDLLVAARISVTTRQQVGDPIFAHWDLRRYEEGSITLDVKDRLTREVIWTGAARRRLRYTANETGLFTSTYHEVDNPRDWRLDEMIEAVTDRLRSEIGRRVRSSETSAP